MKSINTGSNFHVSTDNKKYFWKKYIYDLIGKEISTTTRFCDSCIQVEPLQHDQKHLFNSIECPVKTIATNIEMVEDHSKQKSKRIALLYNGNFSYSDDIEHDLKSLKPKLSRYSRIFLVAYNPFLRHLYWLASKTGLRSAPFPKAFITQEALKSLTNLTGYEIVRVRPCVFCPFPIPLIAGFLNKVIPLIPVIKSMSFVWLIVLRPIIPETEKPSLSIIIPARNEAGNIDNAIDRIPKLGEANIEVIFVEGNSSDDTWQRILDVCERKHNSHNIKAYKQKGKGKYDAVRIGFDNATNEIVVILDADLTMPPEKLDRFYDAYCRGLGDFINGNRLLYQMEDEAMRPLNRMGNIFFAKALACVLKVNIGDTLCGTKMLALDDYRRIIKWRSRFGDFDPFGDFEMLFAASELALGFQDIPIRYESRSYGTTQISRFRDGYKLMRMTLTGFFKILMGKT